MTSQHPPMDRDSWLMLITLSVLWGLSFFFTGVALRELPPFTIVLARAALGAAFLLPFFRRFGGVWPKSVTEWLPFFLMGVLNTAIPFSLFVVGQTLVPTSLASVVNATTPLFTILVLAAFGDEALSARRLAGVIIGFAGVAALKDPSIEFTGRQTVGMMLCLGGALSYALSSLWGKRKLAGVPPITSAMCQLICSALVMSVVAGVIERPWQLPVPNSATIVALIGLAALATSIAYVFFFRLLARAGPANVMLVTLLIPVTAILLGYFILGEHLTANEMVGALIIGCALLIIDGRPLAWLRWKQA